MAFADAVARMRDRQYATMGVPVIWTPSGGAGVSLTGILAGGDQSAPIHGLVGALTMAARSVRVRVSEVSALAPGIDPLAGDALSVDGLSCVIIGAPDRVGARRDEWTIELAEA